MKTISMPLEEYENDIEKAKHAVHQQAFRQGFQEGQKNYLKVIAQIVLQESISNCTIMWKGMDDTEKKVLEKLITTFVTKIDNNPPTESPTND